METKSCPHCMQEIPADSVKCHYCREWVSQKHLVKRVLKWGIPFVILWLGIMLLFGPLMDRTAFRESKYWQHPDAIRITSHHTGQDQKGRRCVIGTMKNVSTTPWDMIAIQVDYYDPENELVDTSREFGGGTLAPGEERSFKVVFESEQRDVEYDHYRVFVAGADDASRF